VLAFVKNHFAGYAPETIRYGGAIAPLILGNFQLGDARVGPTSMGKLLRGATIGEVEEAEAAQ
jgi:hypothetical protein